MSQEVGHEGHRAYFCRKPCAGVVVDLPLTGYVDDLVKMVVEDEVPVEVFVGEACAQLEAQLGEAGYRQNMDNMNMVISMRGPGAHRRTRQALAGEPFRHGEFSRFARYLGGQLSYRAACDEELRARIAAARHAWRSGGESWFGGLPHGVKRVRYIGLAQHALLFGLEPYCLEQRHYNALDVVQHKLLRALLRGKAMETHGDRARAMTNQEVRCCWRVASCRRELELRRLKMYHGPGIL